MTLDWRRALVERYPHLFLRGSKGKQFAPGYPTVGDGWRELVEKAIDRIEEAGNGRIRINQIKEKYGSLRLYFDTLQGLTREQMAAVEDAVALAKARSECTCERCGAQGLLYGDGAWLLTACLQHARGQPIPVRPGFEHLRIEHTVVGGRQVVSYQRYDRETDSFSDIDPKSLGVEE
jgi:hypothetical protein